ncbi:MAG: flavodoxin family protein [Micropruina sp.]|nr:flavodoxin family protein [Micropruina sp.]
MSVHIVYESLFGNTRLVAEAIAEGFRSGGVETAVGRVAEAAPELPEGTDLLLVGGPVHAFGMTQQTTREDAVRQGATEGDTKVGLREWISGITPQPGLRVLTFDTHVTQKWVPGSAAKQAAEALELRGFAKAERGETFYVHGITGPLADGEQERAKAWGARLADRF